jgi:hypothetical protein
MRANRSSGVEGRAADPVAGGAAPRSASWCHPLVAALPSLRKLSLTITIALAGALLLCAVACGGSASGVRDAAVDAALVGDVGTDASADAVADEDAGDAVVRDTGAGDGAAGEDASADGVVSDTGADAGDASVDATAEDGGSGHSLIRIMAANTTSGNAQSYDPGEGIRIFQGLEPDVVLIQEFNYGTNSTADLRAFVDLAFGSTFAFHRESGMQIPNGVISRYPIIEAGSWDDPQVTNREFVWARLDVPGQRDLWAVSLHLLTTGTTQRNTEAAALVNWIQQQVPASDYLVVGGDLNTGSRTEACITTLAAIVDTSGPYPADQSGNTSTSANRTKPYDWLIADSDLDPLMVSVVIGANSFSNGLVFDSRVYTPLTDVVPVRLDDSGAQNMQHMAVVKDFVLPLP